MSGIVSGGISIKRALEWKGNKDESLLHGDRQEAETVAHILQRHNAKMVQADRAGIWEIGIDG